MTSAFLAAAYAIAAFSAGLGPGVLAVEMSTTVAPLPTANRRPAATAWAVTGPFAPATLTGRMRAPGARPAKPAPGAGRAAMIPAAKVP